MINMIDYKAFKIPVWLNVISKFVFPIITLILLIYGLFMFAIISGALAIYDLYQFTKDVKYYVQNRRDDRRQNKS